MLSIRHWKPLFIQHQPILVCLSYLAPIEINAITLGPIVISRDKIGQVTKNHEAIHFQQYLETLFIGFLLVYLWDWLLGLFKYRDGRKAYFSIRAEQEAYRHQQDLTADRQKKVGLAKRVKCQPVASSSFYLTCLCDEAYYGFGLSASRRKYRLQPDLEYQLLLGHIQVGTVLI